MSFQRIHQSKSQNSQPSWSTSQFAPRPFPVEEPKRPPTQEEIDNQAFVQAKFEATRLQLKEKHGTITPVEQERLGMLQAKMDGFWVQRREGAKAQPNLLETFIRNAQTTQATEPVASVQPKLSIGQPNDQYEQEADRVADQVISMPDAIMQPPVQREATPEEDEVQTKPIAASITPLVQREAMPEEEEVQTKSLGSIQREEMPEEEEVQTKPALQCSTDGSLQAGSSIESRLNSSKGGGSPLPDEVRSFMEPRFGADFSQVRVHTGSEAVQMNRELGAQAFTHGSDVYFGAGKAPGNDALTAHELTHVVQQTSDIKTKNISEQPTVQLKCSACENEEAQVQRSPDSVVQIERANAQIQRRVTFDECEAKEWGVKGAHETAIKMCENTIAQLRKYDGTNPAKVKAALAKHFHSTTHKWYFQIAETVAYNLAYVVQNAKDAQYECHDQEDKGSTLAWSMWCVPFTDILLYKKWFAAGLREQANTLVHEWMHRYGCAFDLGYDWEPEYINSGTLRAIHNAEPYGNIVAELG